MIFVNPDARSNVNIPNIGLAYAATHYGVKVVDLNTMPSPADRYLREGTDVLGISVQSRSLGEAERIAKAYREKYPSAKVKSISGFLDVQCCYPYLDMEEKLEFREPFSDAYPYPDYELFDSFPVFSRNWRSGEWAYAIMTSQGCPYQCTYCSSRNRKWLARGPANCRGELEAAVKKWGIRAFVILDDCFNVDKARCLEFCAQVKPLGLTWNCSNGLRADRFDAELAAALRAAGCRQISFGMESTDPGVLAGIKKGETPEQIEAAVDAASAHYGPGEVNGFFIIGLPGSSYEKDMASLRWAMGKRIHAHFNYFVPSEKLLERDALFYGASASPHSPAYPAEQQRKVYEAAAAYNESLKPGLLRRLLRRLA
jgi:radical SAM superfamily enzyme YgiQ (UPF0313 family)